MPLSGPTLRQRFDPRHNSLSVLRLTLAAAVAVVHAQAIAWDDQPHVGQSQVGELAVDGFFVISGFLVTRSATRLPSLRRFVWHRALRILPAFWVCLVLVSFVAAPVMAVLQGRPPTTALSGPEHAAGYVARNAALLIRQWDVADLNTVADEGTINGSLWTLFYEALCYVTVGLLVAAGLLRRHGSGLADPLAARGIDHVIAWLGPARALAAKVRQHAVLVLAIAAWVVHTGHATAMFAVGSDYFARFLLMFLLGALGHVYAHRVRFPVPLLTAAVGVLGAALAGFEDYRLPGSAAFAYLLLWAVVALPLRWEPPVDLSYGLYVYHWPVELILMYAGLTTAGRPAFTLVSLAVAGLLALASWRLVEAPSLRRKDAAWVDGLPGLGTTAHAAR